MVNITKGGDEWAPKNPERRDFLKKSLTWWAALAAMGILWTWLTWCKTQTDRDEEIVEVTKIQPLSETKDFDESLKNTIENLMDLYESLELRVAENFYTTNEKDFVGLLNTIATTLYDIRISQLVKIENNIKQRMDNMIFKIDSKSIGWILIIKWLEKKCELFAKKYPQLVPVIEKWNKR